MIEMGMEEVIRFDFLAMTGRFILISFYSLFHAFMVCSFLFESVYLLFKEKRKPQKKGSMYVTMDMPDSAIKFQSYSASLLIPTVIQYIVYQYYLAVVVLALVWSVTYQKQPCWPWSSLIQRQRVK
jgi:hypothetical protein